jgi:hypothetical protein
MRVGIKETKVWVWEIRIGIEEIRIREARVFVKKE